MFATAAAVIWGVECFVFRLWIGKTRTRAALETWGVAWTQGAISPSIAAEREAAIQNAE
jgi:hypothetical protein